MRHQDINNGGHIFTLGHLNQFIGKFSWTPKGTNAAVTFSVRVRYSDHCYSRNLVDGELQTANHSIVNQGPPLRVFCPERYGDTPRLCQMIQGLFAKPGTSVTLTARGNWTIYQLYTPPGQQTHLRYCAFFRIKTSDVGPLLDGECPLDLFVESGYEKADRAMGQRRAPFGTVAAMTMSGEKYF